MKGICAVLDRNKLVVLLDQLSLQLFSRQQDEQIDLALTTWETLSQDSAFFSRVAESESSFLLPRWVGKLSDIVPIGASLSEYVVLGVDGSQVYPERHVSGVGCFVINTGGCVLRYGAHSRADFFSVPQVFIPESFVDDLGHFSLDMVDLKREECEFVTAFDKAKQIISQWPGARASGQRPPFIFLFDGSLIFWHLEGKPQEVHDAFLRVYLDNLQKFYDHAIPMAGYISMSKSRELVNLIRIALCRFDKANCIPCHGAYTDFPCRAVDAVTDSHLCSILLPEGTRTTIFYSTSKIVEHYPPHLKPAFFYVNVGSEVARIEVPSWVAHDPSALDLVCAIACDQAHKGRGYPVAIAESHEQAVIRSIDRDFFYHVMSKRSMEHQRRIFMSPKSIKKKGLGI